MMAKGLQIFGWLVILGLSLVELFGANTPPPQGSITLAHPQSGWNYTSEQGFVAKNISLKQFTSAYLPFAQQRLDGIYDVRFVLDDLGTLKNLLKEEDLALFLPAAGGLRVVEINNTKIEIQPRNSHYNIGPVIPISIKIDRNQSDLRLRIKVSAIKSPYSGIWRGPPILGKTQDLISYRDKKIRYLQEIPFLFAIIYFACSALFAWLHTQNFLRSRNYNYYANCLFFWGLVQIYSSGILRVWMPKYANLFQFSARGMVIYFLSKIIAKKISLSSTTESRISIVFANLIGLMAISSFSDIWSLERALYVVLVTIFSFFVLNVFKDILKKMGRFTSIYLGILVVILLNDSFKMFCRGTQFIYPLGYGERFLTPLFLSLFIAFLLANILEDLAVAVRGEYLEESARQVVHDIDSPITALRVVSQDLSGETSEILNEAISRVSEITQSLNADVNNRHLPFQIPVAIEPVIQTVIREKQTEYRSKTQIQFQYQSDHNASNLFVYADPADLKRVLSNLTNNSIHAIDQAGVIDYRLKSEAPWVELRISDNGKGIPLQILPAIGKQGFSHGKSTGKGLGIYHAKKQMEAWGGSLKIDSTPGIGTILFLTFRKQK